MRSRLNRLLAILGLIVGTTAIVPMNTATAVLPVPPGGGCSVIMTHVQKNSTTEVPKITMKCGGTRIVHAIELHVVFNRQGGNASSITKIVHSEDIKPCRNMSRAVPYTCSVSAEMPDPSGSQSFVAGVDFSIYRGPGSPVEMGKRSLSGFKS